MAKLTVLIKDELDEKFRETVFKRKGMHRGNITEAVEEAIDLWIGRETEEKEAKTHGKR
jgi:hypothetical protein